jgi:hypothetical protein
VIPALQSEEPRLSRSCLAEKSTGRCLNDAKRGGGSQKTTGQATFGARYALGG